MPSVYYRSNHSSEMKSDLYFMNNVLSIQGKASVICPLNVLLYIFNKEMEVLYHQEEQIKISTKALNHKREPARTKVEAVTELNMITVKFSIF